MPWRLLAVCFWVMLLAAQAQSQESLLVQTEQGPVLGYRHPELNVYEFYSIPYATAERFQPPSPPPSWSETFEAIDRRIICPQDEIGYVNQTGTTMQEDCLIANIFVPITPQRNLPVLVNVHGGAYQVGYGNRERHSTFASQKNIITINFNYRVAILGFLCLGTENVPGNAGIKDQVALLRWVNRNIANFGGNPNDVTISGCSAGSGSVNLLSLSETTRGLIHKVISDSGASLGPFAVQVDPLENARESARLLNFTNVDDIEALEEFYRTAPVELLTSRQFMNNPDSRVSFGPCVERETGHEKFLENAPYTILSQGDYPRYPRMYGFTDLEGLLRFQYFPVWRDRMNEDFTEFLPADLQFETEEEREEVAQTIKEFYFGTEPITEASSLSFIDYYTDVLFAYSMLRTVKLHMEAGNNTIYLYEYSFYDNTTFVVPGTDVSGANHCHQSEAVLDEDESGITEEYRDMKVFMRQLWANFILTGAPVAAGSPLPAWPPVSENRSPHLSIGRSVELRGSLLEQRAQFWDDIYGRYYRAPAPPAPTGSAHAHNNVYLAYVLMIYYVFTWQ